MDYDDVINEAFDFYDKEDWRNASLTFMKALNLAPNDELKGICCFMNANSILEIVKISNDKELFAMMITSLRESADYGNEDALVYLKSMGFEYTPKNPSSLKAPNLGGSSARGSSGERGMTSSSSSSASATPTPTKGKLKLEDGSVYEGDIVNGKPHGKGKITSTIGNVEEGNFVKGKLNGKGVMRTKNNSIVYEGNWLDGKMTGKGKMTYSGGIVEEGDFEIALLHGKGKVTNKNGDVFEGDFEWGHGKGKMTFKNGKVKEGKWEDGKFKGKGLFG